MALLWYFQIDSGHKYYHHHENLHYAPNRLTLLTTITPRTSLTNLFIASVF